MRLATERSVARDEPKHSENREVATAAVWQRSRRLAGRRCSSSSVRGRRSCGRLAVAILFLAVSWLGVWLFAPRTLRIAGVALFALGLVAAIAPLLRLRWPAARDVQARLDRDSGEAHHPATSFADYARQRPATR